MEGKSTRELVIKKVWPLVVSASGALVMILAFFVPSIQDQWDRYQAQRVIQQYVEMGDDFVREENFMMAEEAFTKAYELSEGKRLDVEVKRLSAKVNLIYMDPIWGSKPPEGLKEVDFEFLLHLQKGEDDAKRAAILTSYGIYLASMGKLMEAERVIRQAIQVNPAEALAHINLGNLLDQMGKKEEAEKAYQMAISLEPKNARAHYNLGLLFSEMDKLKEAEEEFVKSLELNPNDQDAVSQLDLIRKELKEDEERP